MQNTISDVIERLSLFEGQYEQDAVEYALQNQEKITPHLIELLASTLKCAENLALDDGFMGHFYSVFLLGHFKEEKAHEKIIQLFSLPGDICESLFNDVITEELPAILFRTCGGNFEQIQTLALNREVYQFCRTAAVDALILGVASETISRNEVLDFVVTILKNRHEEEYNDLYEAAAGAILDLCPEGHEELLKACLDDGYIAPDSFDTSDMEEALEFGVSGCLARLKSRLDLSWDESNFHRKMGSWSFFHEEAGNRHYEAQLMANKGILQRLAFPHGFYQNEVIDEAIKRKDELTPFLLERLEGAIGNVDHISRDERFTGPIFAIVLLAHFKEEKAHTLIIELAMNDEIMNNTVIREVFYQYLPTILNRTSGGNLSALKKLLLNRAAPDYSRSVAVEALAIGVATGNFDRNEVVGLLIDLLSNRHLEEGKAPIMMIIVCLIDLYLGESEELIKETIDEGFLDGIESDIAFLRGKINQAFEDGPLLCIEKFQKEVYTIWNDSDIHQQTGWWQTFYGDGKQLSDDDFFVPVPAQAMSQKQDKKKQKKLKKMKKASKKKNRQKKKR